MRKARSAKQKFRSELCVLIEQQSGGAVSRRDLRADWVKVWPELSQPKNGQIDRAAASDDVQPPDGDIDHDEEGV